MRPLRATVCSKAAMAVQAGFASAMASSNRNVQALTLAPGASGQNILYAGTSGGGVFKVLDDGLVHDPFPVSRTFFVPIIVSSPGVGGAFYESELTLANRSRSGGGGRANLHCCLWRRKWPSQDHSRAGYTTHRSRCHRLSSPAWHSHSRIRQPPWNLTGPFFGLPSPDEAAVFVRTTTAVAEGRAGVRISGRANGIFAGYQLYGLRQDPPIELTWHYRMQERRRTETSP